MFKLLEGATPYRDEDERHYLNNGWWRGLTLSDYLDRAADVHPNKEAFVDACGRMTFDQARERANRLAIRFIEMGIAPMDRVLVQLPNWNEFVCCYFACQKIGAITVLLIDRYRQHDIGRLIRLTGAKAWLVPARYKKVDFLPIVQDIRQAFPQIENVITVRGAVDAAGFWSYEQLVAKGPVSAQELLEIEGRKPHSGQVAHMGPTGGTTGEPKIVPRTHNSLACTVEFCSMAWQQHCEDVTLVVGPIGHDLSFSKGFLGSVITQGKLVLLDSTDNQAICETIQREKATAVVWVPTLAQRLLQYEDLDKFDLSSLKKMHSGGGASHREMVRDVMRRLKIIYFNGYGATEGMTCITRAQDDYETICGTVGRPTCPYDQYKTVDLDERRTVADESGELMVKGPCVFTGYYRNPEENGVVFTAEGFFKTGDIARIDSHGYITLTGRAKEMINRGGESISATEIERLISRHPDVAIVAVVPMPDPLMGERVCAYIEPCRGKQLDFETVITFLRQQNASVLELPERIEFVDSMPYTRTQKLDKRVLRQDIENKLRKENQAQ